ncbi:MAG: hypothetical protein LBN18_05935 [Dysgonamonadaceae bacterium]|jgi:hypothetical protein|nr:hypothetical protein [Dysgonamonadaceae bacterium]
MKKTITTIVLAICFSFLLSAQTKNVNVDNEGFYYGYRNFPSKPQDPLFFDYAVAVNATSVVKNNVSVEEIADALFIEGQTKIDDPAQALMVLELSLGNIVIGSSDVSERKEVIKDKDGNVTGTNYYYRVNVVYSYESSYKIYSGAQALVNNVAYSRVNSLTYTSDEYSSRKAATDYWNNNREVHIANFYRDLVLRSAGQASSTATNYYGFKSMINVRDIIKTINEKKHDENETFRANVKILKDALQAMTPNIPMDKDKVLPLITYFKSIPEKYTDPKSKADSHLRYAAYYNLCKIYLYLDEPDNVYEWADLILANGMDTKDCERMKKAADEVKAAFNKVGLTTRHFDPALLDVFEEAY